MSAEIVQWTRSYLLRFVLFRDKEWTFQSPKYIRSSSSCGRSRPANDEIHIPLETVFGAFVKLQKPL